MSDETPKKRKRQPHINENQRHMIEYLWNIEKMTQADIARRLGYTPSSILRELHRGNTLDFSNLDRRTLLNMDMADCKIKPNTLHKKTAETLMVID